MFKIRVDSRTAAELRNAADAIDNQMAGLLQEIGQSVLSNSRLDFEAKSQGKTGAGGITWAPLEPSTERQKARRGRKPGRTKRGKTRKRDRVTGAKVGKSQIGVNTGLLRNSSKPGYTGPDGRGGNILDVNEHQVTVGYGRSYAEYFDADRPLLPAEVPPEWQDDIDAIVNQWADNIFGKVN